MLFVQSTLGTMIYKTHFVSKLKLTCFGLMLTKPSKIVSDMLPSKVSPYNKHINVRKKTYFKFSLV